MPIYEYVCTACDHRADILHGLNDPAPHFCPSCGREGTMRKLFAPPAIHYRGSGWAKKDRSTKPAKASSSTNGDSKGDASPASPAASETKSAPSTPPSSTGTAGDD